MAGGTSSQVARARGPVVLVALALAGALALGNGISVMVSDAGQPPPVEGPVPVGVPGVGADGATDRPVAGVSGSPSGVFGRRVH